MTAPGYTIPERGARFAGGDVPAAPARGERLPARPRRRRRRDVGPRRDPVAELSEQPDRRGRARSTSCGAPPTAAAAHDVLLASDEAYSELWFDGAPPASALQVGDLTNVLALNTLSKRSSMTGLPQRVRGGRSGADRGPEGAAPERRRDAAGVRAARLDRRVERRGPRRGQRARGTRRSARLFLELFARHGVRVAGSAATFYLWVAVPGGRPSLDVGARAARARRRGRRARCRSSVRRGRDTSAWRWCRRSTSASARSSASTSALRGGARVSRHRGAGGARRGELGRRLARPGGRRRRARPSRRRSACWTGARSASPSPTDDDWLVHEWVKQAVLLYFRVRGLEMIEGGPVRVPRQAAAQARLRGGGRARRAAGDGPLRRVPVAGRGADAELREHRRVGRRRTRWSTRGRRSARARRSARDVHLAGGVGIGGVLEPLQAAPVVIEDGAFIGSRCIVVEGVRVGRERRARRRRGAHGEHAGDRRDRRGAGRAPRRGARRARS